MGDGRQFFKRGINSGDAEIRVLRQRVSYSDFTDGGGASGTLVLSGTIPAGAHFLRSDVVVHTGFTGNVSATLTIGDGSDPDRYNTGTPSIFAAAANGVDMGVASGTIFHATAVSTVTLTVAAATDFTSVSAGELTVSLMYIWPR